MSGTSTDFAEISFQIRGLDIPLYNLLCTKLAPVRFPDLHASGAPSTTIASYTGVITYVVYRLKTYHRSPAQKDLYLLMKLSMESACSHRRLTE